MVVIRMGEPTSRAQEFRVTFDGGSNSFLSETRAKEKAVALARLGIECQLEVRPKAGSLWKLVGTYQPLRGGRYRFVDPYASSVNPASFDISESLQGRVVQ